MNKSMRSKPLENNRGDAADRPRAQRIAAIYRKLRADMDKVGADSESQIFLARRCAGLLALVGIVLAVEMAIQRIWPSGERRHRVLGTFTVIIYCILFVTGSATYTMLYILYPGKMG